MKRSVIVITPDEDGIEPISKALLSKFETLLAFRLSASNLVQFICQNAMAYYRRTGHKPTSTLDAFFLDEGSLLAEEWVEEDGELKLLNPDCVQAQVKAELDRQYKMTG